LTVYSQKATYVNGDTLNNLDENLRVVTYKENARNCGIGKNNKSGHVGVSYFKSTKKWRAYIMLDRVQIHLGYHDKLKDAIEARKQAEIKYFGEYSRNYGHLCSYAESEE
jgi:hypothetical protein